MADEFITERNSFKYRYDVDMIIRLLNRRGISRSEFAKKVGIKEGSFRVMVYRGIGTVDFDVLDKVAVELDVPMEWLVKKRAGCEASTVPHKDANGIFIPKRVCKACGDEFYPSRRNQEYCCRKCQQRRHTLVRRKMEKHEEM